MKRYFGYKLIENGVKPKRTFTRPYFWIMGWSWFGFGIEIDWMGPYFEIALPFGLLRFGWKLSNAVIYSKVNIDDDMEREEKEGKFFQGTFKMKTSSIEFQDNQKHGPLYCSVFGKKD